MDRRVLRRDVHVAEPPLQRRALVDSAATGQREARIDGTHAHRGDPGPGLSRLFERPVFLQGSGQSAAPVAFRLDLLERLGRPDACRNAAELVLEALRLAQRHGGLLLLAAGTGKLDELVERSLGHADGERAMNQRQDFMHGLVERSDQGPGAILGVEKMRMRDDLVLHHDVMTARALQASGVPGVLDLPVARRHDETPDQRSLAIRPGQSLAAFRHHTEAGQPVGMKASAGEGPAPVDPPTSVRRVSRPRRLGDSGKHHVGAAGIESIVGRPRQQGGEEVAPADHHRPADGRRSLQAR